MMWNTFSQCKQRLAGQYQVDCWDKGEEQRLKEGCAQICAQMAGQPKNLIKAHVFAYIMQNADVDVNPDEIFADRIHHCDIIGDLRMKWQKEVEEGEMREVVEKNRTARARYAYTAEADFSHTCPDWDRVLKLGICGILAEIEQAAQSDGLTEEQKVFYQSCGIVYRSVITYMNRLAEKARQMGSEKSLFLAQTLENLTQQPPQNLHEVMELVFIVYYLQTFVEKVNVRSLGGPDRLYYPFFRNDLQSGRFTEEQIRELLRYFMYRLYAMGAIANSPFYLCGEDADGQIITNELSYIILEEYVKLDVNDPKIHIRYTPQLSKDYLRLVMKAIVAGRNSIVFMNDAVASAALTKIGISPADARNYVPVGCYEPCAMGKEIPCTCSGRVNIPKAVEAALGGGRDLMTDELIGVVPAHEIGSFEEFVDAVKANLKLFTDRAIEQANLYERNFMQINPGPLFSGTLAECVEKGADAYAGGAKYNNSSINAFGLANAVDAIAAVKRLVFEEKRLTLSELVEILKNNWEGHEELRLACRSRYPKYGNNHPEADTITVELTEYISGVINGRTNGRGGVYRCGYYSIDWYTEFGAVTSALPDGRLYGTPLSKNMSAVIGCDKNGVTSLINSVTKIDYTKVPNGTALDLMLHTSAVEGEDGLDAMLGILDAYMKKGGIALQINVLNPELLKKAQADPERFSTLQVRLCGWNVYFVNLSRAEQDAFIAMSEHRAFAHRRKSRIPLARGA